MLLVRLASDTAHQCANTLLRGVHWRVRCSSGLRWAGGRLGLVGLECHTAASAKLAQDRQEHCSKFLHATDVQLPRPLQLQFLTLQLTWQLSVLAPHHMGTFKTA